MAFIQAQAAGTIYPCRFVSMYPSSSSTADNFEVIEDVVLSQFVAGVSQEGTTGFPMAATNDMGVTAPTAAALSGQNVKVFGTGEICLVELGGTVNAGDMLKANGTTNGKAIAVAKAGTPSVPQFYGGIALQYGVSGEKIRMYVQPGVFTYAA